MRDQWPGGEDPRPLTGTGTSTIRYASGRYQRGVLTALVQYESRHLGPILVSLTDRDR